MTSAVPNMRGPMGFKEPKPIRDPKHLAKVRALPCVICDAYGLHQRTPTEAHHCKSGRYSQRKECDRRAIPLCNGHHTGDKEIGKVAFHKSQAAWETLFGPDTDYIAITLDQIGPCEGVRG